MNPSSDPSAVPPTSPPDSSAKKKRLWPVILIGCGCLSVIGIVAIVIAIAIPLASRYQSRLDSLKIEQAYTPIVPTGWVSYQNDANTIPDNLKPDLKEHFVEFSLSYPDDLFEVIPSESCFIHLRNMETVPSRGKVLIESLRVDSAWSVVELSPGMDMEVIFPTLLNVKSEELKEIFPSFQEVSRFPDSVGLENGMAMTFEAELVDDSKNPYKIYGKTIILRPKNEANGVAITLLLSSLNPDVTGVDSVGEEGNAPEVLRTFQFKKSDRP